MPEDKRRQGERRPDTSGGRYRESTYLEDDEEEGLVRYARREDLPKSAVLRRALRMLLKAEGLLP